ncbi:MAG: T9SS type A sorting domain-containing protein [Ichthyobacteriaceae bacterium]|nr:T9SS type A sorting domain-containing protein [Ichthyobacteriaceae bacterium]
MNILKRYFLILTFILISNSITSQTNTNSNYNLKYQKLNLSIDPNVYFIEGSVESFFTYNKLTSEIVFDCSDELNIKEVIYHNKNIEYTLQNNTLICKLPLVVFENRFDSILVKYNGTPSKINNAFRQDKHNDVPIIWTMSEPYGAKDWWPCKQGLTDKIDSVKITISTPKEYTSVANGLLINEEVIENTRYCTWKHKYPIPTYLIAVSVTNYTNFTTNYISNNGDIIPIQNFVYPENEAERKVEIEYTKKPMELFETLFEPYPYTKEKYGYAEVNMNGGMENSTISFMGKFYPDLITHELAHQWFGNKITCASWQDIWINEAFATYLTGLTYEHYHGDFKQWLGKAIETITEFPDGSVFVNDTTLTSNIFNYRLQYLKGAMMLHTLRWKIGDDNFYNAIKNYLKDEKLVFNFATSQDMINHFELVYGNDLSDFFNQWLYSEGHPSYEIEWKQDDYKTLTVIIKQTQSDKSVDFFNIPIEIKVKGTNNEEEYLRIGVDYNNTVYKADIDFTINSIEFDPNKWIISSNNKINGKLFLSEQFIKLSNTWNTFENKNNELVISSTENFNKRVNIVLIDINGKAIINKTVRFNHKYLLSLNDLTEGLYILKINNKYVRKMLLKCNN